MWRMSVDPGVHQSGVAIWFEHRLHRAFLLLNPFDGITTNELAIEIPQAYHDRRQQKGDQNDLIALAVAAGEIIGRLGIPTTRYLPRQWKGQVPKDVMVERIKKHLSQEELKRIELPSARSLQHNVFDAIGIGLHHLGRL